MRHRIKIYLTLCFALTFIRAEDKQERHFSLFSVVTFKDDDCTSKSTAGLKGVCKSSADCSKVGGTSDGNCASGFGVCCIIKVSTCGQSVTMNRTYIESKSFPTTYATSGDCSYTVTRCADNICQIRLDFTDVELMQPLATDGTTVGKCTNTILDITPGTTSLSMTTQPPNLCGKLTGQHIYLDSGRKATAATLKFTLTTSSTTNKWRIKVTQIECNNPNRAPPGCMQYFYGSSRHTVTGFNWDGTKKCTTGCLLHDQMYSICFRPEKGMCGNTFTQSNVDSSKDAWDLPEAQDDTIAEGGLGETDQAECLNGWMHISNIVPSTQESFCGSGFLSPGDASNSPGTVTATQSGAWAITVNIFTDIEAKSGGFSIDSQQTPCA